MTEQTRMEMTRCTWLAAPTEVSGRQSFGQRRFLWRVSVSAQLCLSRGHSDFIKHAVNVSTGSMEEYVLKKSE